MAEPTWDVILRINTPLQQAPERFGGGANLTLWVAAMKAAWKRQYEPFILAVERLARVDENGYEKVLDGIFWTLLMVPDQEEPFEWNRDDMKANLRAFLKEWDVELSAATTKSV